MSGTASASAMSVYDALISSVTSKREPPSLGNKEPSGNYDLIYEILYLSANFKIELVLKNDCSKKQSYQ